MDALKTLAHVGIAILIGVLVASIGTLVWGGLVTLNLQIGRSIPWSAVTMAVFLAGYWRYLGGDGWPASTRARRARRRRAFPVDATGWWLAVSAGIASALALAALWTLLSRATGFAPNALPDTSAFSAALTVPLVLMASIVAPVCEEAGYRGYLQSALEERCAPMLAIAISSIVFAAVHLGHGVFWEKQLVYLLGGIVWGTSAWLTRSILPGLVSHAATDVLFFTLVWPYDGTRVPLVPDMAAIACLAMLVGGALVAVGAFVQLAGRRH